MLLPQTPDANSSVHTMTWVSYHTGHRYLMYMYHRYTDPLTRNTMSHRYIDTPIHETLSFHYCYMHIVTLPRIRDTHSVTPRSRRYGDVMATYIREVKTTSRVR